MDEKTLELAEQHGWLDDFNRWNFQGDDRLLRFAQAVRADLLEALQEVIDAADGGGWAQLDPMLSKQRAAVKKARGDEK